MPQRFVASLAFLRRLSNMDKRRVRTVSEVQNISRNGKDVLYWMSRDQRVQDNWALLHARDIASDQSSGLHVCFCLAPNNPEATLRQYDFILKGLEEVEKELRTLNIGFHLMIGNASDEVPKLVEERNIGAVVCDFSPLREHSTLLESVHEALPNDVYFAEVDAHNIVPCWFASEFEEDAAYLIRPKLEGRLEEFCYEFPKLERYQYNAGLPHVPDWSKAYDCLSINRSVKPVEWAVPGTSAGLMMLKSFVVERFSKYASFRNNPNEKNQSNLSPWRHFGQISNQRIMLEILKLPRDENVKSFINEALVWREMAENYCFYNKNYDNFQGAPKWGIATLKKHTADKRDYVYCQEEFENAKTHDSLWNAAQVQMVYSGKMHGFMRMYWAKKILEWSKTPEEAIATAIYLNDKYELDGKDPIGYASCMWSICGVHDRPFEERKVYGTIRYMSFFGCKRKFDVQKYIKDVRRGKCHWG